ncbi:MAG: signal peptidase I [Myxococcota bacterium]|nr:signal peptidase I [Myxococcota bacterium]
MTVGRLLMLLGWTFLCPGAGQGAAGRRLAMWAWAIAGLIAMLAFTWTVWALPVSVALRLGAAVDAALRLRRREAGEDLNLPLIASAIGVAAFLHVQFLTERFRVPASSMLPTIAVGDHFYADKLTTLWSPPQRGEVIVFAHPCDRRSYVKRVIGVAGDTVEVRCNQVLVNGTPIETGLVERSCTYQDQDGADGPWRSHPCSRYRETLGGHTYDTFHDAERPARDANPERRDGDPKDFPSLDGVIRTCTTAPVLDGDRTGSTPQPVGKLIETRAQAGACDAQLHYVVPAGSVFTLGDNRANSNDSRYWGVVPLANLTGRAIGVVWPVTHLSPVD